MSIVNTLPKHNKKVLYIFITHLFIISFTSIIITCFVSFENGHFTLFTLLLGTYSTLIVGFDQCVIESVAVSR